MMLRLTAYRPSFSLQLGTGPVMPGNGERGT